MKRKSFTILTTLIITFSILLSNVVSIRATQDTDSAEADHSVVESQITAPKMIKVNESFKIRIDNRSEDSNKLIIPSSFLIDEDALELQKEQSYNTLVVEAMSEIELSLRSLEEGIFDFLLKDNDEKIVSIQTIEVEPKTFESAEKENQDDLTVVSPKDGDISSQIAENINNDTKDESIVDSALNVTRSSDIDIRLNGDNLTFQTYKDPINKTGPDRIKVSLFVNVKKPGKEGYKIEVPYTGMMPSHGAEEFSNFTMEDDIFSYLSVDIPTGETIIKEVYNDTDNNKVVIKLNSTETSVTETINLYFKFNQEYSSKIPGNQIIWKNLHALIINANGEVISKTDSMDVKSEARDGMVADIPLLNPGNEFVTGNKASFRIRYFNNFNKHSLLDESYEDNTLYFEVDKTVEWNKHGQFANAREIDLGDRIRYEISFTDSRESFPLWGYSNNPNTNISQTNVNLLGFDSLSEGEKVNIVVGMRYRKMNAKNKEIKKSFTYIKKSPNNFDIHFSKFHQPASIHNVSRVNSSLESATSNVDVYLSYAQYSNFGAIKNLGTEPIKNVKLSLYQNKDRSEKVNFASLTTVSRQEDNTAPISHYRIDFIIRNSISGEEREVKSPVYSTGATRLQQPELKDNEYIQSIDYIPMGNGEQEGYLLSRNSISIKYRVKNWKGLVWPDDTEISQNKVYSVPLFGEFTYLDEKEGQEPSLITEQMRTMTHYYSPEVALDASANLISAHSGDMNPGDLVDFEIQGFNRNGSFSDVWRKPTVGIKLPKDFEIYDLMNSKDLQDKKNNVNHVGVVDIEETYRSDTHTYYKVASNKDVYKNGNNISFIIPLQIKVKEGTLAGNYEVAPLIVSGEKFIQSNQAMNTLSEEEIRRYNLSVGDNHTESRVNPNSILGVNNLTQLGSDTLARSTTDSSWSKTKSFGVSEGSSPQMNATIKNVGNTIFRNLRLYDVLPQDGDNRGSSGNIEFKGVSNDAGIVYYTTKDINELPSYNKIDLQTWDKNTLEIYGFTADKPKDLSSVTAIFIDFPDFEIKPHDIVETVLEFSVPDSDNQNAVNQFVYSAVESVSKLSINNESDKVTFSTDIGQIIYNENKPDTQGDVANMPDPVVVTETLDDNKQAEITVSTSIPQLKGYTFSGWFDELTDQTYEQNDVVKVDKIKNKKSSHDLLAQWKANTYTVKFDGNGGQDEMKEQEFKYDQSQELAPNKFSKEGHTFLGWAESENAAYEEYKDGQSVRNLKSSGSVTLYAVWKPNEITIKYYSNNEKNDQASQTVTFGKTFQLLDTGFSQEGYHIDGWSTEKNGKKEYDDKAIIHENIIDKGTLSLYALWEPNIYTVEFDGNGGKDNSGQSSYQQEFTFDKSTELLSNRFQKTGYVFKGWSLAKDGEVKYPDKEMVTNLTDSGKVILFAIWEPNIYTVEFDGNGGKDNSGQSSYQQNFTFDKSQKLSSNRFQKTGYVFKGWSLAKDGEVKYPDKEMVTNLTDSGKVILFAIWEADFEIEAKDIYVGTDQLKTAGSKDKINNLFVELAEAKAVQTGLTNEVKMSLVHEVTAETGEGEYTVKFMVEDDRNTSVEVKAFVKEGSVVTDREQGYYLVANSLEKIRVKDAIEYEVDTNGLIDVSKARAYKIEDDVKVDVTVLHSNVIPEAGTYSVVFGIKGVQDIQLTVNIEVDKGEDPVIENSENVVLVDIDTPLENIDFTKGISISDDHDTDLMQHIIISGDDFDTTLVGAHVVTYNVSDYDLNTAQEVKRTYIVVDESVELPEKTEEFYILANNFVIQSEDIAEDRDQQVLELSKAQVVNKNDGSITQAMVKDLSDYGAKAGQYKIVLGTNFDSTLEKVIIATVKDKGVVEEGHKYYLSAHDFVLGIKDAQSLTDDRIIVLSEAAATHKTLKPGKVVVQSSSIIPFEGIYKVVLSVAEEPQTKITINVTVRSEDHIFETEEYILMANNVIYGHKEIHEVTKEQLITDANAKAVNKETGVEVPLYITSEIDTNIGRHTMDYNLDADHSIQADVTVIPEDLYYLNAEDAVVSLSEYKRSIDNSNYEAMILEVTSAEAYMVTAEGNRVDLEAYIVDSSVKEIDGVPVEIMVELGARNNRSNFRRLLSGERDISLLKEYATIKIENDTVNDKEKPNVDDKEKPNVDDKERPSVDEKTKPGVDENESNTPDTSAMKDYYTFILTILVSLIGLLLVFRKKIKSIISK